MLRVLASSALLSLSSSLEAENSVHAQVRQNVQKVLDDMALKYNMSFSFGFVDAHGVEALASGYNGPAREKVPLSPHDRIPLGSVTKPWTAVAIMQAVEDGIMTLDDPATKWIDPVMQRLWGKSMHSIWAGKHHHHHHVESKNLMKFSDSVNAAALVQEIRIRDLLGMTSGIHDYEDDIFERFTVERQQEPGPLRYIKNAAKKGWVCQPRTCAKYSGVNYVLLGLALVQARGHKTWEELSQSHVISKKLRSQGRYNNTIFMRHGTCGSHIGVAHQWDMIMNKTQGVRKFVDLSYASCLNGWTMGNIASTGSDLATFFYDLFTLPRGQGGFVNVTSLAIMQKYKKLPNDKDWCEGPRRVGPERHGEAPCSYGMGLLRDMVSQDVWKMADPKADRMDAALTGHPGEDWGSGASPCGYNKKFGFGMCLAYTSVYGMNCSHQNFFYNWDATDEAGCLTYNAVLSAVGGPLLNCKMPKYREHQQKPCEWVKTLHSHEVHGNASVDMGQSGAANEVVVLV